MAPFSDEYLFIEIANKVRIWSDFAIIIIIMSFVL